VQPVFEAAKYGIFNIVSHDPRAFTGRRHLGVKIYIQKEVGRKRIWVDY
jgi:hypothetical protein